MSVIVWDGEVLATDRAANDGHGKWLSEKAWYHNGQVITGVGHLSTVLAMKQWYIEGGDPEKFPQEQRGPRTCAFVVIAHDVGLIRYEDSPIPIVHGQAKCAFGAGKDFAYGAMAMGANAVQAVEVANLFSIHCGMGHVAYQPHDPTVSTVNH